MDRALQDYNRAIEIKPGYALAYYHKGNLSGLKEDFRQAILDYSKAIEIDPGFALAYHTRAIA